jgi:hypothetical protein
MEIIPVWKQVTPELKAELVAMWQRGQAMPDPASAATRADQAVCVARGTNGALCGVGTAVLRVLPRLRQPMYYYRQFFTPEVRGQNQTRPFFESAKGVLQAYNASLAAPESLGILLELENAQLAARYNMAQSAATTFIGYSPRGLQLRVSYFEGALLLPPAVIQRRAASPGGRQAVRG